MFYFINFLLIIVDNLKFLPLSHCVIQNPIFKLAEDFGSFWRIVFFCFIKSQWGKISERRILEKFLLIAPKFEYW